MLTEAPLISSSNADELICGRALVELAELNDGIADSISACVHARASVQHLRDIRVCTRIQYYTETR